MRRHVVGVLRERFPSAPLTIAGFSIGGNVLCHYLVRPSAGAGGWGLRARPQGPTVKAETLNPTTCKQRRAQVEEGRALSCGVPNGFLNVYMSGLVTLNPWGSGNRGWDMGPMPAQAPSHERPPCLPAARPPRSNP